MVVLVYGVGVGGIYQLGEFFYLLMELGMSFYCVMFFWDCKL